MLVVSIPQAVSTVATDKVWDIDAWETTGTSFNTASGKYCCNDVAPAAQIITGEGFQYRKR